MGVQGTGGVGGGMPRHRPSHVAYYVALVAIVALLVMLLLYFFYFFIRKVKKLSRSVESPIQPTTSSRPPPAATAYPVQPVIRESASEMAKLCKQLPPPGKGGTVFPTSTSPAAIRTDHGEGPPTDPGIPGTIPPGIPTAPPLPSGPVVPGAPAAPADPVGLKTAPPVSTAVPIVTVTAQ